MASRILVVDDDMVCLKTVQKYLVEEGYEVLAALSGMQAIHIIEETKIDLLLLDIEMPGLSGFATLEQMREMPEGKHLPVVFFTGRQDRDTVKRCAAIGAEGYITKPVEKRGLINRVREVLSRIPGQEQDPIVLMVDNDLEFLKEMKLYLKKYYKVIVVNSGKTACGYLAKHTADVIVLDETLEDPENGTVLEALRQLPNGQHIPVIKLGSQEAAGDRTTGKGRSGAYLKRPVNAEVLFQTIRYQIEGC